MREIVFAGAGGQGVLTAGEIMLNVSIDKGFKATWAPEYGSAMRGGDANCTVKISEDRIYNPMREEPTILLAMNQSSLDKFVDTVAKDGVVIINSDMVSAEDVTREDIEIIEVPCVSMAREINHAKGANIIMTAIIMRECGYTMEEGLKGMNDMFRADGKERFEEANTKAFEKGFAFN